MSTRTTYYNLTKPDADEHVLRTVINQNYDAIDLQMHANAQAAQEAAEISADEYDTTATYNPGDFCIYQNTLYKCNATTTGACDPTKWTATTIAEAFEPKHTWVLFETLTADGTERTVYSSDLPENVSGIMVNCTTQAGSTNLTLALGGSFDGTTWETIGTVSNGINTGIRYSRFWYFKDGNLWYSQDTAALTATNSSATSTERFDAVHIGDKLKKVRIYAPTGNVLPNNSSYEIYIRQ